jgi:hypothetical protein
MARSIFQSDSLVNHVGPTSNRTSRFNVGQEATEVAYMLEVDCLVERLLAVPRAERRPSHYYPFYWYPKSFFFV